MPEISVLMGVYYHRPDIQLLERSVKSVLEQTVKDIELLICDDGSIEEAVAYVDKLAKDDCRVHVVREGTLYSLPEKLNACLNKAKGKWIARMDDDDLSYPERFEKQIRFLGDHPEVAFLGCWANLLRSKELVGVRKLPEFPTVRDFYFTQPFLHPTLIFRREAIEAVGGYSEEKCCRLCEDYDLLLRLYQAGYQGANLPEVLFEYTLPASAKGNRRMIHRWNETVTRFRRFSALHLLPRALPWVMKPLVVGLLPEKALCYLKQRRKNGM